MPQEDWSVEGLNLGWSQGRLGLGTRGTVLEEDWSLGGAEDWILEVLGLGWERTDLRQKLTGFGEGEGGLGFRRTKVTLFGMGPRWIRLENDLVWVEAEED